jgi:heme exporter protein A
MVEGVTPETAPDMPAGALLAALDLACQRGDRVLFRGLNFDVRAGQIVWLRGANGLGKTSLLRVLAGLSSPASGRVMRGTGQGRAPLYLAHANALKDDLTALESLRFLARIHGHEATELELTEALRRFGVHTRRHAPVRTLSQGQRRRVALSRLALSSDELLWLLDEPFDALDVEGCKALGEALSAHARHGGAVLLTSHLALDLREPAPVTLQLDAATLQ